MRLRRIWSEFLPPAELAAPATRALLQRFSLQPIIALPPGAQGPEMAHALSALHRDGVTLGLWPLLDDASGYWPSAGNAEVFVQRARDALSFAHRAGVKVGTLAIDMEPSMAFKRDLLRGSMPRRIGKLYGAYRDSQLALRRWEWTEATRHYTALAMELRQREIESLVIAVPPVVFDLAGGSEVWQRLLSAPVFAPGFETISPMVYSSIVRQALPGKGTGISTALVDEASRRAGLSIHRTCMSLGVVGPASTGSAGKLGDEKCYEYPDELAIDLALVRSHGIDDVALFSLEGVLARERPEEWLSVFVGEGRSCDRSRADSFAAALTRVASSAASGVSRLLSSR